MIHCGAGGPSPGFPDVRRVELGSSEDAMTVSELITLLRSFPADAPAGVLIVAEFRPGGRHRDRHAADG